MKKIMVLLASLATVVACQQELLDPTTGTPETSENKVSLIAYAENESKATAEFPEGTSKAQFIWQTGDNVAMYTAIGETPVKADLNKGENTSKAEFATEAGGNYAYAAFPYLAAAANTISYPATYENYVSGTVLTPMLAKLAYVEAAEGVDAHYTGVFRHVGGMIKVDVINMPAEASKMVFTANDNVAINGTFTLKNNYTEEDVLGGTWYDGEAANPASATTFTFTPKKGASITFYVPVPAGTEFTANGFTVAVLAADGSLIKSQDYKFEKTDGYTVGRARALKGIKMEVKGYIYHQYTYEYDTNSTPEVKGTSPALSPDGSRLYAMSSNYVLACIDPHSPDEDKTLWNLSLIPDGVTPAKKDGHALTPSVGADGTVYAAGYNTTTTAGLYIINPESHATPIIADMGTIGNTGHYIYGSPALLNYNGNKYVIVASKNITNDRTNMGGSNAHVQIFNAVDGSDVVGLHANGGSHGSPIALNNGVILASTAHNNHFGVRVYLPTENSWKFNQPEQNNNSGNLGVSPTRYLSYGSYMAVKSDGKTVYVVAHKQNEGSEKLDLLCFDVAELLASPVEKKPTPKFNTELSAVVPSSLYNSVFGVSLSADETVAYVSTGGYVHACDASTGKILETYKPTYTSKVTNEDGTETETTKDGAVVGTPVVGNDGYVYVVDTKNHRLVKLDGKTLEKVQDTGINVDKTINSSLTMGPDGSMYILGVKDKVAKVFVYKSTATAPADSWSQMGGDWTKAANKY